MGLAVREEVRGSPVSIADISLSLRQTVLSQRPRHQRVEQRAAVLLLESLPEELRHEVVSVRAVTVEALASKPEH